MKMLKYEKNTIGRTRNEGNNMMCRATKRKCVWTPTRYP